MSRKQQRIDSLEQFHYVLSGLAARCLFETLESRVHRDVFIENMTNTEAQNELCRATETEEVFCIALSYERGDKYAITYISTAEGSGGSSTPTTGGIEIKTETVGVIRGGYRNSRGRGREQIQGMEQLSGGEKVNDRRCYSCDKPGFAREHMSDCAAK